MMDAAALREVKDEVPTPDPLRREPLRPPGLPAVLRGPGDGRGDGRRALERLRPVEEGRRARRDLRAERGPPQLLQSPLHASTRSTPAPRSPTSGSWRSTWTTCPWKDELVDALLAIEGGEVLLPTRPGWGSPPRRGGVGAQARLGARTPARLLGCNRDVRAVARPAGPGLPPRPGTDARRAESVEPPTMTPTPGARPLPPRAHRAPILISLATAGLVIAALWYATSALSPLPPCAR